MLSSHNASLWVTSTPRKEIQWCPTIPPCLCGPLVPYPLPSRRFHPASPLLLGLWTWALSPVPAAERRTSAARPIPPAQTPPTASSAPTAARPAAARLLYPAISSRTAPPARKQPSPPQKPPAQPPERPFTASTVPKSTTVWARWRCTSAHTHSPVCAPHVERPSPDPGYCEDTFVHIPVS